MAENQANPSSPTVPMFAPDGTLGDIPYERMHDALQAGAKMGVSMVAPDGTPGVIPADRVQEAVKAGGKIVPYNLDQTHQSAGFWKSAGSDLKALFTSAPSVASPYPGMDLDKKQELFQQAQQADQQRQQEGHGLPYRVGAATVSPIANVSGMEQSAREGDAMGVLGHAAAGATMAAAPLITEGAIRTGKAIPGAATAVSDSVKAKMAGPQGTVMPSAGNLPLLAQSGVEDVFRAAAPTSMNKGFRENLNVAAPDLADIARKVDVSEAKGGIINPDMRVRATVDAIRGHLDEMYQNERAPQIQRNANVPVKVGTNPNSVRGLEYLEATAGDVADSQLAAKAAKGQQLTVAEADQLAQLANQTLRSYEKMTPEGKMQLQATNPKIGGIKALDSELSSNLNDVLQSNGEAGLKGYERRYAALSAVRDQLESRMNATELKQEGAIGAVGRITRPFVKLATEGPSGVPSASQAAVADVNIGRSLQMGLSKLKSSGITAFREPPNIPTRIPQKALPPGPIITPPPADTSGPVDYQPPAYSPTTRAERMGLLLPEQTSIPLPESTLNDRLQIMKAPYRIVRDPRTGRMRKMYVTGEK